MKRPARWLAASIVLLALTPFVVFPEVMGDVGPRNVPLWRNCAGVALLGLGGAAMLYALIQTVQARRRKSRS